MDAEELGNEAKAAAHLTPGESWFDLLGTPNCSVGIYEQSSNKSQ